jgi:hypothetical protein
LGDTVKEELMTTFNAWHDEIEAVGGSIKA